MKKEDLRKIEYANSNFGYMKAYFHQWCILDNKVYAVLEDVTNGGTFIEPIESIRFID